MRLTNSTKKSRIYRAFFLLFILACLLWGLSVWPQRTGQVVILDEPSLTDVYAAGERIRLVAPVQGDAVLAGRDITIDGEVQADVLAAGQSIVVNAPVRDDVRVAAQNVTISASIDGHLIGAGGDIELAPDVQIKDWVWLAGQTVKMYADVGGDVKVVGETVVLDGEIDGDVDVMANSLSLRGGALVAGDLIWRGVTAPQISDQARIEGELIHEPAEYGDSESAGGLDRLLFVLSVALVAIVFGFFAPGIGRKNARIARQRPVVVFVCAFLFVVITPVLVVLSMMTGVGMLLSVLLFALFVAALLASSALGLGVITHLISKMLSIPAATRVQQFSAIILMALVAWLLGFIPGLFAPVLLLLVLLGLGTTVIQAFRARRSWVSGQAQGRGTPTSGEGLAQHEAN